MTAACGDIPNVFHKVLLTCGILASVVFAFSDILGGLLSKGYRFDSQSASVLSAYGASTRPLVLALNLVANLLLIALAVGVWFSAERNWALRLTAVLIACNAVFTMVAIAFFPWHVDEPASTRANTWNTVIMAAGVFSYILAIIFGAVANRNWFRYVSLGIILLYIVGTFLGLKLGGKAAQAGGQVSRMGAQERTMIYTWLLWLVLQAVVLLRA